MATNAGGLAVSLAEMCIGGRIGAHVDIDGTGDADVWGRMWGESLGRIVVAVSPDHEQEFLRSMKGHPTTGLGVVRQEPHLTVVDGDDTLVSMDVESMATAWKGTLDLTGGMA